MKLSFVKELKSHSRLSVVLLTIFLLGCNQITSASSLSEPEPHLMNEPIYGVETNGDSVKFIVKSTGCTQAKHFSVNLNRQEDNRYAITLVRNKADRCRAMPRMFPVELTLDTPLNANAYLMLSNPLIVKTDNRQG